MAVSDDANTIIVGGPGDNGGVGAAWVLAQPVFAGTPGKANCFGGSVSALAAQFGDLGGLEIAHQAYLLSLKGKEAPVLDGFSGDQRFFLGFAQIWRDKLREAALVSRVSSNEHSPAEFRVIGPVPNIDAWYTAYNVQPGDSLYLAPENRIHIW